MNEGREKEVELAIQQALQGLPNLAAPSGFLARTMAAIERPAARVNRSWATWPLAARIGFVVLALAVASGTVWALRAIEPSVLSGISRLLSPAIASVACFWNFIRALSEAVTLAVQQLGLRFMLACFAAAAVACAICAGFGTIFVRLALAKPGKSL